MGESSGEERLMTIQTWLIATVAAGLAGLFAFISGIASTNIHPGTVDADGSAFFLMVFLGLLSVGLVYVVWLVTENRTTFTLNLSNKSK